MKKFQVLLLFAALIAALSGFSQHFDFEDAWGNTGLTLTGESAKGVEINFSITSFDIVDNDEVDGHPMKAIQMPQVFLPNDEGMPNLPGFGRNIAIPQGATARLKVHHYRVETIRDIAIAPAPRIPLDTEDGPLVYRKNERVYATDAYFPAEPFIVSQITQIRGVDIVTVGITPFQYNPVTKELLVYRDIEIEVVFDGGYNSFGDDRLRSRWFDQVLQDAVANYRSLPEIDYNQRIQQNNGRNNMGYEYIIVVPNDPVWMPYAEQIKEWRTKQGIITGIVTLNQIGGNTAPILQNYFQNAYSTWEIPPVAVLLMADYGTNANNRIISPIYNNYCVSDNILADMNNNHMPDIIFARMTAENETHLQTMVSKMLDYESNPPQSAAFYNHPITALGWQTERWFQICAETVGGYWREEQNKQPIRINQIYSGTPGSLWSTATNTATVVNYFGPNGLGYIPASPTQLGGWTGGTTQMITNSINAGTFMILHRDHGGITAWGEPSYNNNNINSLTNTQNNQMPYVLSINCLTGKYNHSSESFTEKFHRHTHNGLNAGALGVLAASEISYSFVNDAFVWGTFDNMQPDFMPDYGNFVDERGYLPAFGQAAGKYFLQQSQWPFNVNNKQVTYHLFHHHGGAFMKIYTEVPQDLTVTHESVLLSGQTQFNVTADQGAYIALTVNGELIGRAAATGQPLAIPVSPQSPGDEMVITVTRQNHFRYESAIEVIPLDGPYVISDAYTINDQLGNNNGLMDYGETIMLNFSMKNLGNELAEGVAAAISTDDPYIELVNANAVFGNIPSQQSVTVNNAFTWTLSGQVPDGHNVTFTVTATDSDAGSWTSQFSVPAHAPLLTENGFVVNDATGNNNGILDPGETVPVNFFLKNAGNSAAYNAGAMLSTSDPYLTIHTTDPQFYGDIYPQQTKSASFIVAASVDLPLGHTALITMHTTADMGLEQQTDFVFNFSDYCYPTANCSWGDGFTGFSLEQISNMSSGCSPNGFGDFTHLTAELEPGETYTVSWRAGYQNQYASLWIDLNSDKVFSQDELLIADFHMPLANFLYATTFTVPVQVHPGAKRLRIRANWQSSSANPCTNFNYGETEDYTVSIQGTTLSAGFAALQTVICQSGQVQFIDQSFGPTEQWYWEFPGAIPSTSTEQNPVVIYPECGNFDVSLTVSGSGMNDFQSKLGYISVHPPLAKPDRPLGDTQICQNTAVSHYTIAPVEDAMAYHWALSPSSAGLIAADGNIAEVQWNEHYYGNAAISVRVSNTCGMSEVSDLLQINIMPLPESPDVIAGEKLICSGAETVYTIAAIPFADSYNWEVVPAHAATIMGASETVAVEWADHFEGTAVLKVAGSNACGDGEWSSGFSVTVFKCLPDELPAGWDLTATSTYHPVLFTPGTYYSIFGSNLAPGSFIGVFYLDDDGEEVCGGARVYTPGQNIYIATFGNDNADGFKNGFDVGEVFRWRIICDNTLLEHPAMAVYSTLAPNTSGTYAATGHSEVLMLEAYRKQVFNISEGWSGFSIPFNPFVAQLNQLFGGIMDDMIIMQNNQHLFWPEEGINTFPGWNQQTGVQVKMAQSAELTVLGMPGSAAVDLPEGWGFLPVISACNVPAADVFGGLHNSIYMVKAIAGNEVYWPEFDIYTLDVLEPGKAYNILLGKPTSIAFPECSGSKRQPLERPQQKVAHWEYVTPSPSTHLIAINPQLTEGADEGDIIGAFTADGRCAGSVQIDAQTAALVLYGADHTATDGDGFAEGEHIELRLWKPNQQLEAILDVTWDTNFEHHTGRYATNGISAIRHAAESPDGIFNYHSSVRIYPNPTGGMLQLSGIEQFNQLSLTGVTGELLLSIHLTGQDNHTLNLNDFPQGVYLVRLTGNNETAVHKIVVK